MSISARIAYRVPPYLPVVLVGNGGGYGYGVMGSTHHALEDYGALLTLANLRVFVPAFDSDVKAIVDRLMEFPHPPICASEFRN